MKSYTLLILPSNDQIEIHRFLDEYNDIKIELRPKNRARNVVKPEGIQESVEKELSVSGEGKKKYTSAATILLIRADILDGGSVRGIADLYHVSMQTVYNLRTKMRKEGEKVPEIDTSTYQRRFTRVRLETPPRTEYVCDIGHHFISNLKIGRAMCPECHSRICEVNVDKPVYES